MPAPPITFAAPLIRAALQSLEANLPGQIAQFNAQPANMVELEVPRAYVFAADDPLGTTGPGFPVVEVAAMEGRTGRWAVDRTEVDHDAVVNVTVWHEGDRGELSPAYEMSLGLARCVIEVLRVPGAFGPQVEVANENGLFWRADALPADFTSDQREFRKWQIPVFLQFRLEAVERFV